MLAEPQRTIDDFVVPLNLILSSTSGYLNPSNGIPLRVWLQSDQIIDAIAKIDSFADDVPFMGTVDIQTAKNKFDDDFFRLNVYYSRMFIGNIKTYIGTLTHSHYDDVIRDVALQAMTMTLVEFQNAVNVLQHEINVSPDLSPDEKIELSENIDYFYSSLKSYESAQAALEAEHHEITERHAEVTKLSTYISKHNKMDDPNAPRKELKPGCETVSYIFGTAPGPSEPMQLGPDGSLSPADRTPPER